MIESAVLDHFSELSRRNGLTPAPPYALSVMAGLDVALAEIFRVPNYARAMVDVYFSPSANSRIVAALRKISIGVPVVWLRAEPSELATRVRAEARVRPLLPPAGEEQALARLAALRETAYAAVADVEVATDGRSVDEVTDAVLAEVARCAA